MKYFYNYFVMDSLSETIVGQFNAISDELAVKMLKATVKSNDKLKEIVDCLVLYKAKSNFLVPETYDEVIDYYDIFMDSQKIEGICND